MAGWRLEVTQGKDFGSTLVILGVEPNLSHERPDHPPLLVNRAFPHHVAERAQHVEDRAGGLVEVDV